MKREQTREISSDFLRVIKHRMEVAIHNLTDVLIDLNRTESGVIWMSCSHSGLDGLRKLERMVVQARRAFNEGQIPLFSTVLKPAQPDTLQQQDSEE